jgi:hypothetical protein
MKKMIGLLALLSFLFAAQVSAEVTFSGDMRVLPRYDIVTKTISGAETTTKDIYYLYWGRIWMNVKLTEGWYGKAHVAADGPAGYIKFGAEPFDGVRGYSSAQAAHSPGRATLRFIQLYIGRDNKEAGWGFSTGILPFNGLANPELDLHFYGGALCDIPYMILGQNSAAGFRGYMTLGPGKLTATLTVDDALGKDDGNDATEDRTDQYSLFADYNMKLGDLSFQPTLIKTFGSEGFESPLTAGANLTLPKIAGTTLILGGYYTMNSVEDTANAVSDYNGYMAHFKAVRKIGPGSLNYWIDYSVLDDDDWSESKNTIQSWLMYSLPLYKSEVGSFALNPTWRYTHQTFTNFQYDQHKFEVALHLTFK